MSIPARRASLARMHPNAATAAEHAVMNPRDTEAQSKGPGQVISSVSLSDYSNVETNLLVVMHRVELNAEPAEGAENRVRLRVLRVLRVSSPSPQSFDANSITESLHSSVAVTLCCTAGRLVFPAPSGKTAAHCP